MSTTRLFRAGLIASVGIAGLTLTAQAQSRYGNIYDYESGRSCGQACAPAAPIATQAPARYGAPVAAPVYRPAPVYNPAPVYVDCVTAGTCAPQPQTVYTAPTQTYTAPAQTYTAPVQSYSSATTYSSPVSSEPVNCPAGTSLQSDGTCLQSGSSSSFSTGTTYSSGSSTTYSTPSYSTTSSEPVSCPAGTTAQSDGTCLQGSSSFSTGSSDFSSSTSYPTTSEPSYSSSTSYAGSTSSSFPADCPAGTTAQSDGTCLQGGSSAFTGSSVEIYTGDASSTTTTTPSYGYSSDGSYGSDYLPIRK